MLIGYARVSTQDQTLDLQRNALHKANCEQIFTDTVSGTKARRPGLEEALSHLRSGDTLVVWQLDRLGRSLRHLIDTVTSLQEQDIGFKSLTENIDTTTSGGKLVFHIFGALAEFEREIIRERTKAGLLAARSRGRKGGRQYKLTNKQLEIARQLYAGKTPVNEICQTLGISRATFYRHVKGDQS
jgi:DNA invertase Pin-like site-specific DNA recombinase